MTLESNIIRNDCYTAAPGLNPGGPARHCKHCMKMMAAVTAAFIARYYAGLEIGASSTDGLNSMALQQGGLGFLLSTLIIMAPPIAATFFQGTLAQFQTYSPFGQIGRGTEAGSQLRGSQGSGVPGGPGYVPDANYSAASATRSTPTESLRFNSPDASRFGGLSASDEIKRNEPPRA